MIDPTKVYSLKRYFAQNWVIINILKCRFCELTWTLLVFKYPNIKKLKILLIDQTHVVKPASFQVFFIIPCLDIYQKIDMRTATYDVPPQEVLLPHLNCCPKSHLNYHRSFQTNKYFSSDPDKGQRDCVCQCHNVLQGESRRSTMRWQTPFDKSNNDNDSMTMMI